MPASIRFLIAVRIDSEDSTIDAIRTRVVAATIAAAMVASIAVPPPGAKPYSA